MPRSRLLLVLLFLVPLSLAARERGAMPPVVSPDGFRASPPIAISDRVLSPSWGREHDPHLAAGRSQALLVWSGAKAVRLSPQGEVLDDEPLALPGWPYSPVDAAWDGSRYLVTTSASEVSGFSTLLLAVGTSTRAVATLARISAAAQVQSMAIAVRGDDIMVVQGTGDFAARFEALLFDRDGSLRSRIDLGVSQFPVRRVVSGKNAALVLWSDHAVLLAGTSAKPLDLLADDAAWTGDGWTAIRGGSPLAVTRVLPDGAIGTSATIRTSLFGSWNPSIAWNGSEYRIAWKEQSAKAEVYAVASYATMAARLRNGVLLDEAVLAPNTDFIGRFAVGLDRTATAAAGTEFLVAWTRSVAPSIEARDVFVTASRTRLVTHKLPPQMLAALSVQPGVARVFWTEAREYPSRTPLLSSTVNVDGHRGAESTVASPISSADAAWNGIDTLAVWRRDDANSVVARRIAADGSFVDAEPFIVSTTAATVERVACSRADCAVVLEHYSGAVGVPELTRVGASGAILDAEPLMLPVGLAGIAARSDDYLIVWHELGYVYSAVLHDGRLSAKQLIADDGAIAVAARDAEWLVCVVREGTVRTIRIDVSGDVTGWEDFSVAITPASIPRLTWDGRHWILAWSAEGDMRGARIDEEGRLVDAFAIAATPDAEALAGLASPGDGTVAVAYTRALRGYVKWLTDLR